jgi:type VI secretion system secreted protein VgrG
MSEFAPALAVLLSHEGGYVNDPQDPGGATNFGWSLRFLKNQNLVNADFDGDGVISEHDIKIMTVLEASAMYEKVFWNPLHLDQIQGQRLANMVLNCVVNVGIMRGVMLLQESVNQIMPKLRLSVDGSLGPLTLKAVNLRSYNLLLGAYKMLMVAYYQHLVSHVPSDQKYLRGWLARVAAY